MQDTTGCRIQDTRCKNTIQDTRFKIQDAGEKESGGEMAQAKSYRGLEIYQLSHKLAVEIHKLSLQLPKFEMFEEGGQIRREHYQFVNALCGPEG